MSWNCPVCHQDIDNREQPTWKVAEQHLKEHETNGDISCWLCLGRGGGRHEGYCSGCRTSFGHHPCPACGKMGGNSPEADEVIVLKEIVKRINGLRQQT